MNLAYFFCGERSLCPSVHINYDSVLYVKEVLMLPLMWWIVRDLNPEPTDYESGALTD